MEVRPNEDGSFTVIPEESDFSHAEWVANFLDSELDPHTPVLAGREVVGDLLANVVERYVTKGVTEAVRLDMALSGFAKFANPGSTRPNSVDMTAPAGLLELYGKIRHEEEARDQQYVGPTIIRRSGL